MQQKQPEIDIPSQYQFKYKDDYQSDWAIHRRYVMEHFDNWEAMLIGQVYDSVSKSIDGGKITDSYTTTLAKERSDRVIAKLPTGQIVPFAKADAGKAALLDILVQKWVFPNANAQHSLLEKFNMWDFYSAAYGYMPMFYDINVSPSGYMGPDAWLWNPRNLVPQQGRASISDMEYVTALTWVSKTYLQDILDDLDGGEEPDQKGETGEAVRDESDPSQPDNEYDESGWDKEGLRLLIQAADRLTNPDPNKDSKIVRERTPQAQKRGVLLATRFEAGPDGHWITFAPDCGNVQVRDLPNPHKNGRIPFVIKYSQPLYDSFYGLGDFQRAMPLQFARDGLTNFYFKGIKMNLVPPIIANQNGVVKHTLDYREGSIMLETIPNSIRRLETSTAGLATYQSAQTALTGSLLSMFGSQNAAAPAADTLNPSQGKTPQAINLYNNKEATRDGADRRHLEDAISQLIDGFITLIVNCVPDEVPVALLADDIQDIVDSGLADVKEIFTNFTPNDSNTGGQLRINPKKLRGIEMRFHIDPDSTAKDNKAAMLTSLQDFMAVLGKFQNMWVEDPGVNINWQEIMSTYESLSGIPNAHRFITFDQQTSEQAKSAAMQQGPQLKNPVKLPNGNQIEMSDLVKLFDGADDQDEAFKNAILAVIGVPAVHQAPPQEQTPPGPGINQPGSTITSQGNAFNDPHLAAAAEAVGGMMPPEQPEPLQPTTISSGHTFNDGNIASAAEAINNLGK